MTALYNIKSNSKGWQITKFDGDLNPDTSYQMIHMDGVLNCSCPQMAKPKCRHRNMFPEFVLKARIDTNWFFDYDTRQWRQYVGPFDQPEDTYGAMINEEDLAKPESPAPSAPLAGDQAGGEQLASPSPPAQFKRRV